MQSVPVPPSPEIPVRLRISGESYSLMPNILERETGFEPATLSLEG